jgi:hypothetical protein
MIDELKHAFGKLNIGFTNTDFDHMIRQMNIGVNEPINIMDFTKWLRSIYSNI